MPNTPSKNYVCCDCKSEFAAPINHQGRVVPRCVLCRSAFGTIGNLKSKGRKVEDVQISSIKADGGTQNRVAINTEHVKRLEKAYKSGATIPPVVVYYDGSVYWLADGFHSYLGAIAALKVTILAEVRAGTQEDAIWASCAANIVRTTIPRTDADKRLVVERALKHKEAAQLSLRGVAVHCGVPIEFVEQVKKGTNNKNEKTTSVPKRVVLSDVRKRTIASPKRSVITNSTAAPKSQSVRTSTRVIKISNREEIGRVISDLHALYGKVSKDEREEVLHFVRVFLAMNERKARVNQ